MTISLRSLGALVTLGTVPFLLASCGQADPREELSSALTSSQKATSLQTKVSLEASPETRAKYLASKLMPKDASSRQEAESWMNFIADSSFTMEAKTKDGKPLSKVKDPSEAQGGYLLDNKGVRLASLLDLDGQLHLKVDGETLATRLLANGKKEFQAAISEIPVPWIRDAASNRWVTFDDAASKSLNKMGLQAMASPLNLTDANQKISSDQGISLFMKHSTVTREGDFIKVDLKVKDYLNELNPSFTGVAKQELQSMSDDLKKDSVLPLYMKISDGKITQTKVNLGTFAQALDETKVSDQGIKDLLATVKANPVNLVMDTQEATPSLNVPSPATKVTEKDLQDLMDPGAF